ncbi:hypothetical protein H0H81_011474, partial [Sphagnurus paluster]
MACADRGPWRGITGMPEFEAPETLGAYSEYQSASGYRYRSVPKSLTTWPLYDRRKLEAYNIRFEHQDAETFFGVKTLPPPSGIPEEILDNGPGEFKNPATHNLLEYVSKAGRERGPLDLVAWLLPTMGYTTPQGRTMHLQPKHEITVHYKSHKVTPGLTIENLSRTLLVVRKYL